MSPVLSKENNTKIIVYKLLGEEEGEKDISWLERAIKAITGDDGLIYVITLVGPTRTGKSHLAKEISRHLTGLETDFITSSSVTSCTIGLDTAILPFNNDINNNTKKTLIILDCEGCSSVDKENSERQAKIMSIVFRISNVVLYTERINFQEESLKIIGHMIASVNQLSTNPDPWPSMAVVVNFSKFDGPQEEMDEFLNTQLSSGESGKLVGRTFPDRSIFVVPRLIASNQAKYDQQVLKLMNHLKGKLIRPLKIDGTNATATTLSSFLKREIGIVEKEHIVIPPGGGDIIPFQICKEAHDKAFSKYKEIIDKDMPARDGRSNEALFLRCHNHSYYTAKAIYIEQASSFIDSHFYSEQLATLQANCLLERDKMITENEKMGEVIHVAKFTKYEDGPKTETLIDADYKKHLLKVTITEKFRITTTRTTFEQTTSTIANGDVITTEWIPVLRTENFHLDTVTRERDETGGIISNVAKCAFIPIKLAVETVLLPINLVVSVIERKSVDWKDFVPGAKTIDSIVKKCQGGRVLIYDDVTRDFVQPWWKAGSILFSAMNRFDHVIHARSWSQVNTELKSIVCRHGKVKEIQFWGHGDSGAVFIDDDILTIDKLDNKWNGLMESDGLVWIRSCLVFRDAKGRQFAKQCASAFGCKVASHTIIIHAIHKGLVYVSPGQEPSWGDGVQGSECLATDLSLSYLGN